MTKFTHSDMGAVAAGHVDTARVGARILEAGGNAVDAVVGMMFAGPVVESTLTSLGGGGFMIINGPEMRPTVLDFFVRQPGFGTRPFLSPWESYKMELGSTTLNFGSGPASVAVPGMVKGIAHASALYGRLPLTAVAAPAAELATTGITLTQAQEHEHNLCHGLLVRSAEGRAIYADQSGDSRKAGTLFRQLQLAGTIEEIAATQGASFYTGRIADQLMRWSDERGGRISREDLLAMEVCQRQPLIERINGITVMTNPPPTMGGTIIGRLLATMVADSPPPEAQDEWAATALVQVLRQMRPPLTRPPVDGAVVHAGLLPEELKDAMAHISPDRADPPLGGEPDFSRSPNTTHVAALDSDGMIASATSTVGFGSGEFVPGTGIQLNNVLAEYDHTAVRPPGVTVPSMMAPTLLEGSRTMVTIGSAGSDRIPQAISQILRRLWADAGLVEAIDAPRFVYDGSRLHCEPGFDPAVLTALDQDLDVVRWSDTDPYFGTSNAVAIRDGRLYAHGDVRREGAGIVL